MPGDPLVDALLHAAAADDGAMRDGDPAWTREITTRSTAAVFRAGPEPRYSSA
jgi:hypothetical protein